MRVRPTWRLGDFRVTGGSIDEGVAFAALVSDSLRFRVELRMAGINDETPFSLT